MELNATLLVQVCNILVAYGILRSMLLRPLVTVLESLDKAREQAHKTIAVHEEHVVQQEQEKERRWRDCQQTLWRSIPQKLEILTSDKRMPEPHFKSIPADELTHVALQVADSLIEKVKDARQ